MVDFIKNFISDARFKSYFDLESRLQDGRRPDDLYRLNLLYSKELYVVLSTVEIAIRNTFHEGLKKYFDTEEWFYKARLEDKHIEQINDAKYRLVRLGKPLFNNDDIIAQLNFGFWVHLCDRPYEQSLWVPVLRKLFPFWGAAPARPEIEKRLRMMLTLRNKIAHHEAIIKEEEILIQYFGLLKQMLYAISPELYDWIKPIHHFETLWQNRLNPEKWTYIS